MLHNPPTHPPTLPTYLLHVHMTQINELHSERVNNIKGLMRAKNDELSELRALLVRELSYSPLFYSFLIF
jgi:hypothetical protein